MGKAKRKSDQAALAVDIEVPREPKRSKRQAAAVVSAAAAAETAQPPKKQQADGAKKVGKKADKKQKAEPKPKRKQQKQKKQQPQEDEEEEDENDEVPDVQQEDQPGDKSVHDTFMEEVHAKEEELQKHCLIMDQVETEEDETTLEALRALNRVFVPQQVQDDFMEVWAELDEVGEDSDEEDDEGDEGDEDQDILGAIMQAILGGKMLNTKHSSQMHAIFRSHQDKIDKAIKSKSWQEGFCRWAATLMAAHREKHWYEDTDVPKSAEAIYNKMRQQWLKLKARSNEELGGLVAEGDRTAKEEFDAYLQAVADDMKAMDYKVTDVV